MAKDGTRNEAIFRTILWLAVADVFVGAALALGGAYLWERSDLSWAGTGLVVAGGLLYGLMRLLGARPSGPQ
ncbi:MAG: hypothetical protein ACREGK_03995 [Geminicoccales bacterium]